MAYIINRYSGAELTSLADATVDTSTSISLVGRNYIGYGELQNENFLYLLENFSNEISPSRPVSGQTWFNTSTNNLYVYDGQYWSPVGNAVPADAAPENPAEGSFWLKQPDLSLHVWTGTDWLLVGPEVAEGFDTTQAHSTTILGKDNRRYPVIQIIVNGLVTAIFSSNPFSISPEEAIPGFDVIAQGFTLSDIANTYKGNLDGVATRAAQLDKTRQINGVGFNGTADITISATTHGYLEAGDYVRGTDFNGYNPVRWDVDATPNNIIGTVVARDSSGNFKAGTITADVLGNLQGNVTSSGTSTFGIVRANEFIGASLSGNAFSATKLQTTRTINGVPFDGTSNINVPADANTLVGDTIKNTVTKSSLEVLGTLTHLNVADTGINVGLGQLSISTGSGATISAPSGLTIEGPDSSTFLQLWSAPTALSQGGENLPSIAAGSNINLGHSAKPFNKLYATDVVGDLTGNADTATVATYANNVNGGAAGALPYQSAASTTAFVAPGAPGQVLRCSGTGAPVWGATVFATLDRGNYLTGLDYDGNTSTTWSVDATPSNVGLKVVARDGNGDFSARRITADLVGNVTGNSTTATRLQTPRSINGVPFDGTGNITINATDPNKVALSGGSMSGYLTLNGNPVNNLHAATKQYVDSVASTSNITYGNTQYSTSGYTNQVGSWNNSRNYFDVFPPSGKSMGNLIAFMPSIAVIHYAGGVDGNDSLRCTWSNLGDRIRVYVQNTEQRSTPAANWLAVWS